MKKLIAWVSTFAVAVALLAPSDKPAAPAANAAPARQPGLFEASAYKETELTRKPNGNFYVTAYVNGAPISFVVDTGASIVALSESDARAARLHFSKSEFAPVARTANGVARGQALTLPKVSIEGKEVMEVEAMVIEGAEQSLLGQSYLARITGVQMNGDTMVLR
jgi:aspartyl protease family protein